MALPVVAQFQVAVSEWMVLPALGNHFDGILAFMEHGHPYVLLLFWSPLSPLDFNGLLVLREVGGWRSLAWRRGIGDHNTCTFQNFEKRGEEHWVFLWVLEQQQWRSYFLWSFCMWQLEEHSHCHFGEGAQVHHP
eukprot:Gb_33465 [translate_table: standard]